MSAEPTLPVSQPDFDQIAIDLARELYDRFVMGGWIPADAHAEIVRYLMQWYEGFSQERDRELQQARRINKDFENWLQRLENGDFDSEALKCAELNLEAAESQLREAREELAWLKEALIKYGNHVRPCERANWKISRWPEYPCTCGFTSALAVPEKPKEAPMSYSEANGQGGNG